MAYTLEKAIQEICRRLDDNYYDRYADATSGYYNGAAKERLYSAIDLIAANAITEDKYKNANIPVVSVNEFIDLRKQESISLDTDKKNQSYESLTRFSQIIDVYNGNPSSFIPLNKLFHTAVNSGRLSMKNDNETIAYIDSDSITFYRGGTTTITVIIEYLSGIERIADNVEASTQDLLQYIGIDFIEKAIDYAVNLLIIERVSE